MTKIQWTNETWNPFAGCSKISAGCKNCYAIRDAVRLSKNNNPKIANKYAGTVLGSNWSGKINLAPEDTLLKPLRWTRPRMIFVNSMSDLFHENVPDEWIDKVFAIMALSPNHTFQILTKRAERMQEYINEIYSNDERLSDIGSLAVNLANSPCADYIVDEDFPFKNVWLGVSVENQQSAEWRIPFLLRTPAAVRWLSCEPLLERVNLTNISDILYWKNCLETATLEPYFRPKLDWVVVGGESGENARVCNVEWIRDIVNDCQDAGVPVFVKQLGSVPIGKKSDQFYMFNHGATLLDVYEKGLSKLILSHKKGGDIDQFPSDLRVREYPKGVV